MSKEEAIKDKARKACPQLRGLPKDWTFNFTTDGEYRVIFQKTSTREQTFLHPTLGALPRPWILQMKKDKNRGSASPIYFNRETGDTSTQDPRFMQKIIERHSQSVPQELSIAAKMVLMTSNFDITKFARSPIQDHSIQKQFQIVH